MNKIMEKLTVSLLCLCLSLLALPKEFVAPTAKNLALGKECSFLVPPDYQLCTDDDDCRQLTDGKFDDEKMWWHKEAVGWRNSDPDKPKLIKERPIGFTIDLGKVEPIQGFMYSTVAGEVGITFPYYICIYTSLDGKNWHFTGDLVKFSAKEYGAPSTDIYTHHKFASLNMHTKGRYVAFVMKAHLYCFIDEIEIYKGDDSLLAKNFKTHPIKDLIKHHNRKITKYQQRLINDIEFLCAQPEPELETQVAVIQKEIDALKSFDCKDMLTILPLSDLERKIFALNSVRLKKAGFTAPSIWRNNRWDNLPPMTIPPKGNPEPLEVEMMRNEIRGEAFNIVNPTDAPINYDISIVGLPKDAAIDCREVLFTDTPSSDCVSSALKPGDGDKISVEIPAGISKQIWISFKKPSCKAGTYKGVVKANGSKPLEIPITLTIYDIDFPARPRIHVGGWDYTEGDGGFYKMPQRLDDNLKIMRDMYVDTPWAHNNVAPQGEKFDEEGHLTNKDELDYTEWNRWTKRWSDARIYCIFMAVAGHRNNTDASWHGEKTDTVRFRTMVNDYYKAWAEYMTDHGIKPSQVAILLIDEPGDNSGRDTRIVPWARAIKAAVPDFRIFNDPTFKDVSKCDPALFELSDIICPKKRIVIREKQFEFYENLRKNGKTLWLFSCRSNARLLDPVTYYRAQHWRVFMMGGEGSLFWALGSGGGRKGNWNAYSQGNDFTPYFVSDTGPFMESKQYEGIREGVQDYEYLCMLRDRIAELKEAGQDVAAAEKFLAAAPERGIVEIKPPDATWSLPFNPFWNNNKDRSVVDKVRIEVLQMLNSLVHK